MMVSEAVSGLQTRGRRDRSRLGELGLVDGCARAQVMLNHRTRERLMMKRVLAACMAFGLVGCASELHGPPALRPAYAPPPPPATVGGFRASDFAWSTAVGDNTISGVVVHRGRGGWSCAGQSAALTPQTRYSTERIRQLYGSSQDAVASVDSVRARSAENPGADYGQFVRSTTCDVHNAFAFHNLPDGGYFLIVRVHGRHGEAADAGTVMMQRVEVRGGASRQVVLPAEPHPA
jgi:hypothetical protein